MAATKMSATTVVVLCVIGMLSMMATRADAAVEYLTMSVFQNIASDPVTPNPWVIRFANPSDPNDEPMQRAFVRASEQFDPLAVHFGVVSVNSAEGYALADANMVATFPTIRLVHARLQRAIGPKSAAQSGRPLFHAEEFKGNQSNANALKTWVLSKLPTRYMDPLSYEMVPSVNFILSKEDLHAAAAKLGEEMKNPNSLRGKMGVFCYFDLMKPGNEMYLGSLFSGASQAGRRIAVFATEDPEVAELFTLYSKKSMINFPLAELAPFAKSNKVSSYQPITEFKTNLTDTTVNTAVSLLYATASLVNDRYSSQREETEQKWEGDVAKFMSGASLRKLETTHQFHYEIVDVKTTIALVFLLRETDDFFTKHHKTAVEVSEALKGAGPVYNPATKQTVTPRVRYEVFWVDAEVHKDFPAQTKTKEVPAVAALVQLSDGKKGVRFIEGKKGEWLTTKDILGTILASNFLESTQGMHAFDATKIVFNDGGKSKKPKLTSPKNNEALILDLKVYPEEEEKESPLLEQLATGKLKEEQDHYDESSSKNKKKKAKKKAPEGSKEAEREKIREMKKEAAKKQLEEEMLRKKKEKEERIRQKAEKDKVSREESLKKAKQEAKEQAKKERAAGGGAPKRKKSSDGADDAAASKRPKLNPNKPPKDTKELRQHWAKNGKKMAEAYTAVDAETKKIRVIDSIDLSKEKKSE